VFVIEANPRASRTVPFVAKATGVPLAKVATRVMLGATLAELRDEGLLGDRSRCHVAVKEAVLPFNRFPEADPALGPRCARPAR
jgi:carbamoyl-phosphate synthase large subunit